MPKKWTFIKAHTNHTAAPIVKSGLIIAFSKICGLHRREICAAKVLSLHSLLERFRAESFSCLESLNHSLKPNASNKWTFIKAHTNHTAAPIVKSGLVIGFSKICGLQRREICAAKLKKWCQVDPSVKPVQKSGRGNSIFFCLCPTLSITDHSNARGHRLDF